MFLSGVLMPFFFVLALLVEAGELMFIPLTILFIGLSMMLYWRLFGEETSSASAESQKYQPSRLGRVVEGEALPPASNIRIDNAGGQRGRTAEIVQPPPSITESTTKLLDRE